MGLETNGQFDPDTLRCLNTREREALTFGGSSGIDEGSIGAGNRSDRAFNDVTTRNNGPLLDNDDPTGPQLGSSRGDEAIKAENKT
jgi:hypothetical protein